MHQGELKPFNQIPVGLPLRAAGYGITARQTLSRHPGFNGGVPGLVATISNNTQTDYLDTTPDDGRGAAGRPTRPARPRSGCRSLQIPIGPGNTTARRLYRRFEQQGPFKLVTTLTNNSETTYLDTKANAALGVDGADGEHDRHGRAADPADRDPARPAGRDRAQGVSALQPGRRVLPGADPGRQHDHHLEGHAGQQRPRRRLHGREHGDRQSDRGRDPARWAPAPSRRGSCTCRPRPVAPAASP